MQTLLLATDFRPASLDATELAVDLAAAFGARATLCHVFQPFGHSAEERQNEREVAEWQIRELAQQLGGRMVAVDEALIMEGHPADCIVRKAQDMEADLVLLGAGKWTREPFAPGPIAEAVLHHCRRNVLTVRPGRPAVKLKRILCPVDQSEASELALRTAVEIARPFEGALHVVTVVPDVSWLTAFVETGKLADAQAWHKQHWRQEFEKSLARVDFDGVPWRHEIRHGVPHEEIVASAREHNADVIVMGSTGRTGLTRLLMGSVARRVLQDLPCSLWSVKHERLAELEEDLRFLQLLMAEGRELFAARDYRPALLKFRQVVAHNRFHADAWEAQAEIYDRLGQLERAGDCRKRAEITR
ncbi:MAG: universal stress protein [Gemmataceae bacterium]|nr:universal stress protein [Gemmataceae bacterium]